MTSGRSLTQQLSAGALGFDSWVHILAWPLASSAGPMKRPDLSLIYEMWVIIGPDLSTIHDPALKAQSAFAFLSFLPSWLLRSTWRPGGAAFALLCFPSCPFSVKQRGSYIPGNAGAPGRNVCCCECDLRSALLGLRGGMCLWREAAPSSPE